MNFKILETSPKFADVLVFRDIDSGGNHVVKILAIGTVDEGEDEFIEEEVRFDSPELAKRYVADFTVESAESFCVENDILYET